MEASTENGVTHEREEFDAIVTPQDLLDSYMPPFKRASSAGR